MAACISRTKAQVYEKLFSFTDASAADLANNVNKGSLPIDLVEGIDGSFYGMTEQAGPNSKGTVFKVTPDGVLTTLVEFTGTTGSNKGKSPRGKLVQSSDGNFYGTTYYGGANDYGTVFKVTPAGVLTTLVEFTDNGSTNKGRNPFSGLVQDSTGNFYGTTNAGGASGDGTIFRITPGGVLTTLVEFTGAGTPQTFANNTPIAINDNASATPYPSTITVPAGIVIISKVRVVLRQFSHTYPTDVRCLLVSPNGTNCLLMSGAGGADDVSNLTLTLTDDAATAVSTPIVAGSYQPSSNGGQTVAMNAPAPAPPYGTQLSVFNGQPATGTWSLYMLDKSRQDLGSLAGGWSLELTPPGSGAKGKNPQAGLVQGSDGCFYGTTDKGGWYDLGTVFKVTPAGVLTTLVEFTGTTGGNKGSEPMAGLMQGSDGVFYGTTWKGGTNDSGTVFKMTPAGVLTTLVEFTGTGGSQSPRNPNAGLIEDGAGNFYGTTQSGGANNNGTVFKITPAGVLTTLVEFTGTTGSCKGSEPCAGLAQGCDGNFYGTTYYGGTSNFGTVFRVTPDGVLTTLLEFRGNADSSKGSLPLAGLIQGGDGNFYGTTNRGSANDCGTVFKMTPGGLLTTLVEFTGTIGGNKGSNAIAGLVQGSDGNFYGTTANGGTNNNGTVYKVTPDGVLTTLVEFSGTSGSSQGKNPYAGLIQSSDGNFYGTTMFGGVNDLGAVFKMTPTGILTTLVAFSGTSGANRGSRICGRLVEASDGNFYGTTELGGVGNLGTVFKMTPGGVLTTLVEFTGTGGSNKGSRPTAGVVQGGDGNFYGTTWNGGASDNGTVFKMTPGGLLTTLVEFTGTGGSNRGRTPYSVLVQGTDGNFYGTTGYGGTNDFGTVFRMTSDGVLTTLLDLGFDRDASFSVANVMFGSDGNLYGVAGGNATVEGCGSIFRFVYPGAPYIFPVKTQVQGQGAAVIEAKVNARGATTTTVIEYGSDGVNFPNCLPGIPSSVNGFQSTLVGNILNGLSAVSTYYYRFRATSSAGTTVSPVISFATLAQATAMPAPATQVQQTSARFNGTVNAHNDDCTVVFQYGTDGNSFPYTASAVPGLVSGATDTAVSAAVAGLTKGTTYYYRIAATIADGTTVTGAISFNTLTEPTATAGGVVPLSTTSAQVSGTLNAQGSLTQVVFEYGTGGADFSYSVAAMPATASGTGDTPVTAVLTNLVQGNTYHFRVKGTSAGGIGTSTSTPFQMATLSGLAQAFPNAPPEAQGYVFVTMHPADIASGWRFVGEQQWRASGVPAGGLATGDRLIEFRPVPGYIQPPQETVGVVSGEAATFLERTYFATAATGSGGLSVTLKPDSLAAEAVPAETRAQWRLVGDDNTRWRDSGATLTGLLPGNYLIECKPVTGRTTPPPTSVLILKGQTAAPTVTYFLADALTGTQPGLVSLETVTTDQTRPYAYVGQIRSDVGSSSGFVVKQRVVATAGHVVFDDGTLSAVTGLQWLFQRHRDTYEPKPQIPRGFYVFDGYAAQRAAENTPGTSSPQSQNLDAAALYFLEDAGRGGYGGFLASDLDNNEFLLSPAPMMLVGYPVDGISAFNQGRMFATPPAAVPFVRAFGHTYTTSSIRSSGGGSGGPLCIRHQSGAWYPAAIYLGGSGQTVVLSIDSQIIGLFNRAEVSGNGGDNNTGGGITHTSVSGLLNPEQPGSLKVLIEPAAALTAGAGWCLNPETTYRLSGAQKGGLSPGSYTLLFPTVPGFPTPSSQSVEVTGGQLTTVTFTYLVNILSPAITSTNAAFGTLGQEMSYQIVASRVTDSYSLTGSLPAGLTFNHDIGLISGTPGQAGVFAVALGATNAGGTGTLAFTITVTAKPLDVWRMAKFGTYANAGTAADNADPDHDGQFNLEEYAAGTDPNSAADLFKVLTCKMAGTTFILTAAGKAGRTYILQRRADLAAGEYITVATLDPLAAEGPVVLTDLAAPSGKAFYRIQVTAP